LFICQPATTAQSNGIWRENPIQIRLLRNGRRSPAFNGEKIGWSLKAVLSEPVRPEETYLLGSGG